MQEKLFLLLSGIIAITLVVTVAGNFIDFFEGGQLGFGSNELSGEVLRLFSTEGPNAVYAWGIYVQPLGDSVSTNSEDEILIGLWNYGDRGTVPAPPVLYIGSNYLFKVQRPLLKRTIEGHPFVNLVNAEHIDKNGR